MLPFAESFIAIVSALVLPAFAGLFAVVSIGRSVSSRYLAAFALGLFLWFFSDTIGDSSYLGVNSGFAGGVDQLALVVLFAAGLLLVFSLDRSVFSSGAASGLGLGIPLLVAFAVGFHGFGEGAAFSATAAATPSSDLLQAFGGPSAAVAFILHKGLEPMMIGAVYSTYAKGRSRSWSAVLGDVSLLTLVFVLPGVVGGATDYFLNYETTFFFAFGLGTSFYAVAMIARALFLDLDGSRDGSLTLALLILLGFLCLYLAALFHS